MIDTMLDILRKVILAMEAFAPELLHEELTAAAVRRANRLADAAEAAKGLT